jgi:putative transcriptional regulator
MTERAEFSIKGAELLAEPYHYNASGLDNIYLLNGVSFEETAYGPMVTIENIDGLHRAIGLRIITKPEQMTGAEFRFLRKQMGLSQANLAQMMGVSDQTIANYEKGNTSDFGPADAFVRIKYFLHILPDDVRAKFAKEMAKNLSNRRAKQGIPDMSFRKMVNGWTETCHGEAA